MHPTDREHIDEVHYDTRIEILLESPKGSYFYVFAKSHNVDDTCPEWAPRGASEDEEDELELIKDMQAIIKRYMAARNRKLNSIDNEDTEGILYTHFGMDDIDYYGRTYIAALNSLDFGYPSDYNPCSHRDQNRTLRHWGASCN
jgi:hypothetical protein